MNRIAKMFERVRECNRAALIGYLAAGDPDPQESFKIVCAVAAAGVDAVELGYPFSDPVLDGPVIQRANRRALQAGASLASTLELVARLRDADCNLPIVLMGYYNPILAFRPERFVHAAAQAGVDALIVADLPIAEATAELLPALAASEVRMIPIYSPMLEPDDFAACEPGIGGFVYCIPRAGHTGGPAPNRATVERALTLCRAQTRLPIGVGFGIKTPRAAAGIAQLAEGVIVGSALVAQVERCAGNVRRRRSPGRYERITAFVADLRAAVERS